MSALLVANEQFKCSPKPPKALLENRFQNLQNMTEGLLPGNQAMVEHVGYLGSAACIILSICILNTI